MSRDVSKAGVRNSRSFFQTLHREIHEHATLSMEIIADLVGKSAPALYRELNPDDDGAKLGVHTWRHIVRETGCYETLGIVANENGFVLVNIEKIDGGSEAIAVAASKAVRGFAALLDQHARGTDPKGDGGSQFTRCEAEALERAGFAAAQAILELVVAANREAGRDGNIPVIERKDAE